MTRITILRRVRTLKIGIFLVLFGIPYLADAQLANGYKASDFTMKGLNNQDTYTLYSMLDQGKYVIVDFFATWCEPCWEYHNKHHFDALLRSNGPNTTLDNVRVFGVELDSYTSDDQVFGIGNSTWGNWVSGVSYPVCNLEPANANVVNDLYSVEYYPTLYLVCPDRTVKEIDQLDSTSLRQLLVTEPICSSKILKDGAIRNFNSELISCDGVVDFSVGIQNRGFDTLSNFRLALHSGSNNFQNMAFTSQLTTYQLEQFNIPALLPSDTLTNFTLDLEIENDANQLDNKWNIPMKQYRAHRANALPYHENYDGFSNIDQSQLGRLNTESLPVFDLLDGINDVQKITGIDGKPTKAIIYYPGATFPKHLASLVIGNFNTNTDKNFLRMQFDWAKGQVINEDDSLEVIYSTDCGQSWEVGWSKHGSQLVTTTPSFNEFFPSKASHWTHESFDFSQAKNIENLLIGFRLHSGFGNNGFIDNISLVATNDLTAVHETSALANVLITNPSDQNVVINFGQSFSGDVHFFTIDGRKVEQLKVHQSTSLTVDTKSWNDGLYVVQMVGSSNERITKKIVIGHL